MLLDLVVGGGWPVLSVSAPVNGDLGGHNLDNLVFIGFGLIGFGLAFFIYMLLSGRPENDEKETRDFLSASSEHQKMSGTPEA